MHSKILYGVTMLVFGGAIGADILVILKDLDYENFGPGWLMLEIFLAGLTTALHCFSDF